MEQLNTLVEQHYYQPELYEEILERLKGQGIDIDHVARNDIAGVDEFHVRGAEVSNELVTEYVLNGSDVLDVGCGIGGPSRMLAVDFDCRVTGIDISQEFIRTAQKLSELVTEFIQADALNLPFKDGSFDVVWTQHVQMNISDKSRFYSEINRVLNDTGMLIYYDIFRNNGMDVTYPVPWANDVSVSFLGTIDKMDSLLKDMGFTRLQTTDQTSSAFLFLKDLFKKIKMNGSPKIGLNVLMGDSTKVKLIRSFFKAGSIKSSILQKSLTSFRNLPVVHIGCKKIIPLW